MKQRSIYESRGAWAWVNVVSSLLAMAMFIYSIGAAFAHSITGWVIPVYDPVWFHATLFVCWIIACFMALLSGKALNEIWARDEASMLEGNDNG